MHMTIDHYTRSEIESDISRIDVILGCGIFNPNQGGNPLLLSALTELLILVRDLLAKSQNYASRVDFTDDVSIKGNVIDVTSLISFVRDAVCHIDSEKHHHDEVPARISFNVVFGAGCFAQINDVRIESQYSDDIAFFFGPQRVYLYRHIIRAYKEAASRLRPLLERRHA
jgi:hypothetical protein